MSPTARSLEWFEETNVLAQVVERHIPYTNRTVDLFGFIDIVALDAGSGVLGVQVTTTGHLSHRMKKIQTECREAALRWLEAGNRIVLHGWSKKGARGRRKGWTLTVRPVCEKDLGVDQPRRLAGDLGAI